MPAVVLLRPSQLARYEAGAPVPGREYALLAATGSSPRYRSRLLSDSRATWSRSARGTVPEVSRQGDVGDRFYLIAEGELDAFKDDTYRRTMVPATASARSRSCVTARGRPPCAPTRASCCWHSSAFLSLRP
jgi:hypothetical protein